MEHSTVYQFDNTFDHRTLSTQNTISPIKNITSPMTLNDITVSPMTSCYHWCHLDITNDSMISAILTCN